MQYLALALFSALALFTSLQAAKRVVERARSGRTHCACEEGENGATRGETYIVHGVPLGPALPVPVLVRRDQCRNLLAVAF